MIAAWTRIAVLLFLIVPSSGCLRLAKQGLAEVRGAQARRIMVSDYEPAMLADFEAVQFDPVTSSLPSRLVDPAVRTAFDAAYRQAAGSDDFQAEFGGGGPALRVSTEIQYLQKLGVFRDGLCISRVRMHDGARLVLDLLVKASNESLRAGDTEKLAKASAESVVELLVERPAEP
jgi:hypothetical protein